MARRLDRAAELLQPVELGGLPRRRLLQMAAAARELVEIDRQLATTGENVVAEVLRQHRGFYEWDHYPPGDVLDPASGAQYYYHAHAEAERFAGEHGHFHTFLRPQAPPRAGLRAEGPLLCHLVAVAMTDAGEPFRLFTVNRWVTGETWYDAPEIPPFLDRFAVEQTRPAATTNRWIGALLRLFRPDIEALQAARDRAVAAYRRRRPDRDVFEDRDLDVLSTLEISVPEQRIRVERALKASAPALSPTVRSPAR